MIDSAPHEDSALVALPTAIADALRTCAELSPREDAQAQACIARAMAQLRAKYLARKRGGASAAAAADEEDEADDL